MTQYVAGAEQLAAGAKQLSALENLDQVSTGISQLNAAVSDGNSSLTAVIAVKDIGRKYNRREYQTARIWVKHS